MFNLTFEAVTNKTRELVGTIIQKSIQIVAYANNIVVFTRHRRSVEEITKIINKGMGMNEKKTNYMKVSKKETTCQNRDLNDGIYGI